eukprot:332194-Prymnesium_polylepis.1
MATASAPALLGMATALSGIASTTVRTPRGRRASHATCTCAPSERNGRSRPHHPQRRTFTRLSSLARLRRVRLPATTIRRRERARLRRTDAIGREHADD